MIAPTASVEQIQKRANLKKAIRNDPILNPVEVDKQGTLKIETCNIHLVTVKYYNINAELLFSRQPFIKDNTEGFTYVMPFETAHVRMVEEGATEATLR